MNREALLTEKYELQIAKLEEALSQAENVIQIQEKCIRYSEELLKQKDEYISILESKLDETAELGRTMAQILDSQP